MICKCNCKYRGDRRALISINWVALIAEYYRILVELPNTTYKVPNTNILLKLKLIFGFRRVKYIYWVYKKLLAVCVAPLGYWMMIPAPSSVIALVAEPSV